MNTGMAVDGNLTMGNFLNNSYFAGSDDEDKRNLIWRLKYNYDDRYFLEGVCSVVTVLHVSTKITVGVISTP